jgi:Flp pilus assembly protein TadG
MMAWFRNLLEDRNGAAAAEMALLLPLLMVMLFATFEGGYFLWNEHKVVKSVRDGVRYAGRQPFSAFTCPGTVDGTVEAAIKNVTRTGFPDGDNPNIAGTDNPTVVGWSNTPPGVTVTLSCTSSVGGIYASNSSTAPIVTVSASVPYPSSPLSGLVAVLGFDTDINLNATAKSPVMGI